MDVRKVLIFFTFRAARVKKIKSKKVNRHPASKKNKLSKVKKINASKAGGPKYTGNGLVQPCILYIFTIFTIYLLYN